MKLEQICEAPRGFVNNFEYAEHSYTITGSSSILGLLTNGKVNHFDIEIFWMVFVYDSYVWVLSGIEPDAYSDISLILSYGDEITDEQFSMVQAMLI